MFKRNMSAARFKFTCTLALILNVLHLGSAQPPAQAKSNKILLKILKFTENPLKSDRPYDIT